MKFIFNIYVFSYAIFIFKADSAKVNQTHLIIVK